ncbi:hypothetical protein BIU98_07065 [Curtobacterium sp. MMLR14_010]|uniref:hypothetical protein n=1 Tax=Curtobacterium sp. MMLR14_010 TaxID=1898743 RepID=UPI0008DDDCDF|nr:hypothetical protein [Curtobacterium sp. MMLR14_010]OII33182.1 hypothetical protein BIU98_07065 [Curtobacterium sp. MMLR14_010]
MGNAHHEEHIGTSMAFRLLGIGMVLGSVAIAVVLVMAPSSAGSEPNAVDLAVIITTMIIVAGLGVALAIARMSVVIDDALVIRMTPFWYHRTIDPATITEAVPVELRGSQWGGWGIRFGLGTGTGVLMDNGPGVRLRIRGKRDLSFRCEDPYAVIAALRTNGASTGARATGRGANER